MGGVEGTHCWLTAPQHSKLVHMSYSSAMVACVPSHWVPSGMRVRGGTKLVRGVCNLDVGECYCDAQFYGERCEYVR